MLLRNVENRSDAVVNCEVKQSQGAVELYAKDIKEKTLSVMGFSAKEKPTVGGLEVIKTALTAAMIGKFRKALAINLNFELDPRSFEFIRLLNSEVIGELEDGGPPILTVKELKEQEIGPVVSMPNSAIIGRSGGRDSLVAEDILRDCGFSVRDFKVDFGRRQPVADYSTYEFNDYGGDNYDDYEPFDIPLTYFAPLWRVKDRFPQNIAIGLSFDALGFGNIQRRAPYESPTALTLHQQYLDAIFDRAIRLIYPVATLSTYSVFEYIRRRFGLKYLESLLSCWDDSAESDCGYCDKCQRIKLAASAMHIKDYEYLKGMPQVIDSHSYLFGNPLYDSLVSNWGADALAESQLFRDGSPHHEQIVDQIGRRLSGRCLTIDRGVPPKKQLTNFDADLDRIRGLIGVDYSILPKERINHRDNEMPYEQYFGRDIPVIAAHGEIPVYDKDKGWSYERVEEGPRLEVPDTLLFRNFFNTKGNE